MAGVQREPRSEVAGFVLRESLTTGLVRDHVQMLAAEHLISDATPLADLLSILGTKERLFVLIGQNVRGIVTRSDLNKPPVRVYLFGLVSLFEMHVTFWTNATYPNES
jgi:hypothetical protein